MINHDKKAISKTKKQNLRINTKEKNTTNKIPGRHIDVDHLRHKTCILPGHLTNILFVHFEHKQNCPTLLKKKNY